MRQICDSTKNFIVLELFFDYQKNALFSKIAISQQIQYNTQLFKIVALELALNSLKIKTKNQKSRFFFQNHKSKITSKFFIDSQF